MDNLILKLIILYQRFISPRKGYRCAYGVLHNTQGCSGAVKKIIQQKGTVGGWQDIRRRFADCRLAAETLQQQDLAGSSGDKKRRKRKRKCDCSDCGDTPGCDNRGCSTMMPDSVPDLDCDCSSLGLRRYQRIKKSPP